MAAPRHAQRRPQQLRHLRGLNRVVAVDWSGARTGAERKIWLCEVADGRVRRLECGRGRDDIRRHLVAEAKRDPGFAVGLDFAFSLPAPFLRKRGHDSIENVWREVTREGELWLVDCPFPFWGKKGTTRPRLGNALFRRTEVEVRAATGLAPKSVFQLAGPGAVGVGSLRGMPILSALRRAGFRIWPFDPCQLPLVVEIWPRLFMGAVKKRDRRARWRWLAKHHPELATSHLEAAKASDDAFDALVSALEMDHRRDQLARLEPAADEVGRLEGEIFRPLRS